jgi:hypothetical protein
MWALVVKFVSFHPSGASHFEVALRVLENEVKCSEGKGGRVELYGKGLYG